MKSLPSIADQATGDKWGKKKKKDNQEKSDFL